MPKQKTSLAEIRDSISKTYVDNVPQWLDRIISLAPAAAIAGYAYSQNGQNGKDGYNIANIHGKAIGIPLGVGIYALSQIGLSFANEAIESMDNSPLKKSLKFTTGLIDEVNDAFIISPAINMVPKEFGFTFGVNMLPKYLKGIEADIKSIIKGDGLDGYYAGNVFPAALAGTVKNALLIPGIKSTLKDHEKSETFASVVLGQMAFDGVYMLTTGKSFSKDTYFLKVLESVAKANIDSNIFGLGKTKFDQNDLKPLKPNQYCEFLDCNLVGVKSGELEKLYKTDSGKSIFDGLTGAIVVDAGLYILKNICELMESGETVENIDAVLEEFTTPNLMPIEVL